MTSSLNARVTLTHAHIVSWLARHGYQKLSVSLPRRGSDSQVEGTNPLAGVNCHAARARFWRRTLLAFPGYRHDSEITRTKPGDAPLFRRRGRSRGSRTASAVTTTAVITIRSRIIGCARPSLQPCRPPFGSGPRDSNGTSHTDRCQAEGRHTQPFSSAQSANVRSVETT